MLLAPFIRRLANHSRVKPSSKMLPGIKTFVFFDLETTGLPHEENNTTRITEVCMVAVQSNHVEAAEVPRVVNKLSLCLNPQKIINPRASDLTGLTNELLEDQQSFSVETVELMKLWLQHCEQPVCLVAHNGGPFDFPILRAEIEKTGRALADSVLVLDALPAFRALELPPLPAPPPATETTAVPMEFEDGFDEILVTLAMEAEKELESDYRLSQRINETTPKKQIIRTLSEPPKRRQSNLVKSYKLLDVYKRLTGRRSVEGAHQAEADVLMLITCAVKFGHRFVDYANMKAKKFSQVAAMQPGRRLGY